MNKLATTLNVNQLSLALLFVFCVFPFSDNNKSISEPIPAGFDLVQDLSEIRTCNLASTEIEVHVATIAKLPSYDHFFEIKSFTLENHIIELGYSLLDNKGLNIGSKIRLFILYCSFKIPS